MTTRKTSRGKTSGRKAPWRGKTRVPDAKTKMIAVRCRPADYKKINTQATNAGLSIGAYLRLLALGDPGARAVRRPSVATRQLAKLLGSIGSVGNNINQITHRFHLGMAPTPPEIRYINDNIQHMRSAVMRAIRRGK